MKLLEFPVLVQQMIFEEMTNVILLLLSLGSFNMKKMIKLTQRKRLRNIGRMVFCTGSPNEKVYISNIIYNQGKPVRERKEPILGIVRGLNAKKDWCQVKMGELIYFKLSDNYHPILCYSDCNKETLIKCLHSYLKDFFGGEREYQWRTHANNAVYPDVKDLRICITAESPRAFWVLIYIYNLMDWSPIPKADILEYTGCGKLDESKFGPLHTAPLVCGSHGRTLTTNPFRSHDYVVRESVRIEDFCFIFGVWEMTETEFLKMTAKEGPNLRLENLLFD
ncbi:unnamed protein product [Caenorhabditis nigoni]